MLKDYLQEQGFEVNTAANGREALFVARESAPDLILLDIMMPELDGMTFIKHFRKKHNTPVIMLTARVDEEDKVAGLDLGADDYVTKPASLTELLARINANLRRNAMSEGPVNKLSVHKIELFLDERLVKVDNTEIKVTPSEFAILKALLSTPGRVYSRLQLLEELHDMDLDGVERTIDVHIRNLRKKIEPDDKKPIYIESVYGAGYRLAKP